MRIIVGILMATSLLATGMLAHFAGQNRAVMANLSLDWRANPYVISLGTQAMLPALCRLAHISALHVRTRIALAGQLSYLVLEQVLVP